MHLQRRRARLQQDGRLLEADEVKRIGRSVSATSPSFLPGCERRISVLQHWRQRTLGRIRGVFAARRANHRRPQATVDNSS